MPYGDSAIVRIAGSESSCNQIGLGERRRQGLIGMAVPAG
jgi:hypothetical protein